MIGIVSILLVLAGDASPSPPRVVIVDFQSSARSRHSCLIAAALTELRRSPGARVIGIGLPSKTLLWWEEIAPEMRVGILRRFAGLYTMEELCASASDEGGFSVDPKSLTAALKKAYAGHASLTVTWIQDRETRTESVQPGAGTPDTTELRKSTIALLEGSVAHLAAGCLDRAGPAFALVESPLKQRLVFAPGEKICVPELPRRLIVYDEPANWLGIAMAQ